MISFYSSKSSKKRNKKKWKEERTNKKMEKLFYINCSPNNIQLFLKYVMYLRAVICFHLYGRFAMMKNRIKRKIIHKRSNNKSNNNINRKWFLGHQAWTQKKAKKYWNKMFYAIIKLSVSVSFLNVY